MASRGDLIGRLRRSAFGVLILVLGLVGLHSEAAAVSFGKDDRIAVGRGWNSPYRAIGMLFYEGRDGLFAAGTAVLVSPCHVLTAYHVAGGGRAIDRAIRTTFYVGEGDKGPSSGDLGGFARSSRAHPVIWGRYVPHDAESSLPERIQSNESNGWEDWALLKLDKCLGAPNLGYGYLKLSAITTRDLMRQGRDLNVVGIGLPVDKPTTSLWMDPKCRIVGQMYFSGWQHDCITFPGNSGGPLLGFDNADSNPRVLAINVSHIGVDGLEIDESDKLFLDEKDPAYYDYLSVAVPVSAFIHEIIKYLPPDPDLQAFVAENKDDEHYGEGDESKAIDDLSQAIHRSPKNGELLLRRGLWHRFAGHAIQATQDLGAAARLERDPGTARFQFARLMLDIGDRSEITTALDSLDRLTRKFPRSTDVLLFRGLAHLRLEDHEAAIADFDRVLEDRPRSAAAANERGDAFRSMRDYERALADYTNAIAYDRLWPEAYRDRGFLHHLEGRYELALADFDFVLNLNPNDAEGHNGRGLVNMAMGRVDAAIEEFDRAIALTPASSIYFTNRATAKLNEGRLDLAIGDFRKATDIDPNEPFIRLLLFIAEQRKLGLEKAQDNLASYVAGVTTQEWPRPIIDYVLGEGSIKAIEDFIADAPEHMADGYSFDRDFYLGEWALAKGNKDEAVRRLKRAYDSRRREFLEYDIARADLLRLGVELDQSASLE